MKIEAKQRLREWYTVEAMPQLVPEEHEGVWFDPREFCRLVKKAKLFEYEGHSVYDFELPNDPTKFFVALNAGGSPVYIHEVLEITPKFGSGAEASKFALHGYLLWSQKSVSFSADADRQALKGLATKIFWDYLATNNVATTYSQQSPEGYGFCKKILTSRSAYWVIRLSDYTCDTVTIESGADRFTDASHLQYDIHTNWKDSADGKLLRVLVKRDKK